MTTPAYSVLVIDDDEEEYRVVSRYLRKASAAAYAVTWIPSYEKALAEALDLKHDICLLDYHLGEHTGIGLLRAMRAAGYQHPVILLTGHGNVEVDIQAMELGAFDYLEKSGMTADLLERSIRYAIENHRVREELRKTNADLERRVQERTAELHRSNLELEQFAEVVAGDLQEPLRRVLKHVNAYAPAANADDPREALEALREMMHGTMLDVRNLDLLVTLVLEYSLTRKQRAPFDDVDLAAICREACQRLDARIKKAGARVEIGELPVVKGDARLLAGLFENLLDNALKYRSERPLEIRINAVNKGDVWLCQVRDNGVGIAEEDFDEIVVMFERGGDEDSMQSPGIGLPLCRKIVEYHSGRLWADSGGEAGTTICFSLPVS